MAELSFAFAVTVSDFVERVRAESLGDLGPDEGVEEGFVEAKRSETAAGRVRAHLRAAGLSEADVGTLTVEAAFESFDSRNWTHGAALFTVTVAGPLRVLARVLDLAETLGWEPDEA